MRVSQIQALKQINELIKVDADDTIDNVKQVMGKVKGIGTWTIRAWSIRVGADDNIFLYEDLWIRNRIKILIGSTKPISLKESRDWGEKFNGKIPLSHLTRFLWRLKEQGAYSLAKMDAIKKEHFI